MSYRPPSSDYRQRRYSPSREVSGSPPPPLRSAAQLPPRPIQGMRREDRYSPRREYSPPPRRYSPPPFRSRSPVRRYDSPPRRERSPPPVARGRPYSPPPVARAYNRSRSPPYRPRSRSPSRPPPPRYGDYERRRSGEFDRSRDRSPPRAHDRPKGRMGAEDFYPDDRRRPDDTYDRREQESRGMAADREPERSNQHHRSMIKVDQWERGRDQDELASIPPMASTSLAESSGRRSNQPSGTSEEVILIGVDDEATESNIIDYLRREHRAMVDSVKIIRKRFSDTGRSNHLAFVTFASLQIAEDFVSDNFPAVVMPAFSARGEPKKVRIDFAAPPDPTSTSTSAPSVNPHIPLQSARVPHDGMRDVGPMGGGNRVLVLRQLDAGTYGEAVIKRISEEMAKMLGRVGDGKLAEQAIHRVVSIVDRVGSQSWGICFVELATTELASALLPYLISPHSQPSGFRVSGIPVAASFASTSSFLPTPAGPLGGQYLVRSAHAGGIGSSVADQQDGEWCSYWHQQGGAIQTLPRGRSSVESIETPELSAELRAFLGHLSGPPPAATTGVQQDSQAGFLDHGAPIQPIKIGVGKKRKEEPVMVDLGVKNLLGDDDVAEEDTDTQLVSRTKGTNIVLPQRGRKVANNINKWNTKQTELAKPVQAEPAFPQGFSDVNKIAVTRQTNPVPAPAASEFDYADTSTLGTTGKVACLLCQRQFKTEEVLRKHIAQSDLHKARSFLLESYLGPQWVQGNVDVFTDITNLLDPETVAAGKQRKASSLNLNADMDTGGSDYRDRAAERRKAFNQPDKPGWSDLHSDKKRRFAAGPSAGPPPPPLPQPGVEPGKDDSNVGNQLLAKMGWKSGTGLGMEGVGRIEPIKVQQFAERAGLGASQGHAAGTWTGAGGRQQQAHDVSQARYNASGSR